MATSPGRPPAAVVSFQFVFIEHSARARQLSTPTIALVSHATVIARRPDPCSGYGAALGEIRHTRHGTARPPDANAGRPPDVATDLSSTPIARLGLRPELASGYSRL